MSQINTLMLFRCTEQQYAESFCNTGSMKFNTPQYWIDIEKKYCKGRGDLHEGAYSSFNAFDNSDLSIYKKLRKNVYVYGEPLKSITYLRSKDILNLPCFCLYGLNDDMFTNIINDEKGEHHCFSVVKEYFQDFSEDHTKDTTINLPSSGKPALLIIHSPRKFFDRVRAYFLSIGVKDEEILILPVRYIDKSIPFLCSKEFPMELFLKDKSFSYQNEIRIVINTKNNKVLRELRKNNNTVNIGNMKDIADIEGYYYEDMFMELRGNNLLYVLPEPIVTPLIEMSKEELVSILYQITYEDEWTKNAEEKVEAIKNIKKTLREKYGIYHLYDENDNEF